LLIADRYEIDDLPVGRGGMGAVHHGLDTHLGRRVAVKFLRLAPLAVDLPPLPGFLAPDPGPGRRYACVWGRTA
jgi:hypothetical protein